MAPSSHDCRQYEIYATRIMTALFNLMSGEVAGFIDRGFAYSRASMMPFFETARLSLRPATRADRENLVALERDPEVMRFLNGGRPTPSDGVDENADFLMPRGGEEGVWVAMEKPSGDFVGWFSLRSIDTATAVLGYRLSRAMWGRNLATEGAKGLIEIGFTKLGYRRIIADTMTINHASRRVLEKAGLRYVRTVHVNWPDPLPGSEHGDVEYAITAGQWRSVP